MLMCPPTSPTFTTSHSNPGKVHIQSENLLLSPKQEVDLSSLLELDCYHMHPCMQSPRRTSLDPLSASDLENRRSRNSHSTDSVSYHSLVTPPSSSDLRILLPKQPVSSGSCTGMQRSGTPGTLVCSWPPPTPIPGTTGKLSHSCCSLVGQRKAPQCPVHRSDEKNPSRVTSPEPTSTSEQPSDVSQIAPTTTMNKSIRATSWKSENVLHPIRSRTNSLPSVRRPPGGLWRSDASSTKPAYEPIDIADSVVYFTPPGLPPRRPELRRSNSVLDVLPHGSVSLSLALGSQPLRASEPTRAVPPIGAERSRVVSITSLKSRVQTPPAMGSDDPGRSPWRSAPPSPGLQPKWSGEVCLSSTPSQGKLQSIPSHANVTRADLERILHQTVRNKHAPKIISPLSPLRTATSIPAFDLSADPAFRLRMPSQSNHPSLRYSRPPPRRARTLCDGYQSFDWDTTCMHCQECKRDTVGKKLLAFRYRQQLQQTRQHFQRNNLKVPRGGATATTKASPIAVGVDDDRIALASRIRETYAYEIDEEEKSLWEEVAAVTGAGPLSFSVRTGAPPCGVAAYRGSAADVGGNDDSAHDDCLEIQDEGLLANESATLFRNVSVY